MNQRTMAEGMSFLLAHQRTRLIHGVLKSVYLRPSDDDYQDCFQEACLLFAQAYCDFPREIDSHESDLMHFTYQKIRWRLLDQRQRTAWQASNCECSLDSPVLSPTQKELLFLNPASNSPLAITAKNDLFARLAGHCTRKQRNYLLSVVVRHLSDSEIAEYYGVSRQTVYQWKKGVIAKARQLLK
ncbi:helix-turn-helix domain-containing protein [uncultured Limosilactobacillus sp.]|uniref:helix-turn-helix domain-containing protein n=1 Tax=uncultured Limosilactobacillus sp. TaxID=2837629 RepID=UPI0025D670B5|nr:helix-turn-helix domain-containing protein [uncultured Limosilactobacillus sp.]